MCSARIRSGALLLPGSLGDAAGLAADLDADGRGVPESTVRSVRLTTSASITIPAWLLFAMFHRRRDNVPERLPERVRVHVQISENKPHLRSYTRTTRRICVCRCLLT